MFAKLTAFVGGGYSFPYTVAEEPYPAAWGQWAHYPGTTKEDGSPVSVFKMSAVDPADRRLAIARNGIRRLKMLRHPNILAYKDSTELQEKGQTVVYLVTQAVQPLKMVLEELNLSGQHRLEYLSMGILHMTNAVSFLNNDCKLIHGNVCLDSVVVTETLDWKLHGFDLLSEHTLPADQCLLHASWMVGAQYKAGELGKGSWDVIRESPPWAVDAWGLGCLMQEVYSQERMTSVENLRRTSCIPQALLGDYQKLLSSNPSRRLNPAKVAESKCLNNRLVDVVNFMENISVKDSTDKDSFFKRMGSAVPSIPPALAVRKILPLLSHALEFGGAPPSAVGPLLQIGNTLDSEDFNKRVVPSLSKLYSSPDRALRRSLLESIDTYAQHLTTQVLEEQIYVHLQTGFTDSNAYIRELTLKAILSLAPKLTNKTLVNNVLKHLSKLQVDEEASIRANTTVLLGNISKWLGEATCKRVLINAFTRALKDQFVPAKLAGLRALMATKEYHSEEDAALRIVPVTAPLVLDPVPEVRSVAIHVLDVFVTFLKESDAKRAQSLAASSDHSMGSSASGVGTGAGAGGGAAGAGMGGLPTGSSMLNWAVSSLMTSTGLAVKQQGGTVVGPVAAAVAAGAPTTTPSHVPPSFSRPAPGTSTTPPSAQAKPPAPPTASGRTSTSGGGGDGWGDGDGWDEELQVDDAEMQARARLSTKTSSSNRPAASRPAATAAGPAAGGSRGGSASGSVGGWDDAEETQSWEAGTGAGAAGSRTAGSSARPVRATSGAGGGTGAKKPGAMKLGASKLGANKMSSSALGDLKDFDEKDW